MARLAADPHYFARPDRALFQDIRRYFPITAQAQVAWAVREGVRRSDRVHRGADRGRRVRRRRRPLQGDDAQGQGLPAHAAAEPRLLPVAPASRAARHRRGLDATQRRARFRQSDSIASSRLSAASSGKLDCATMSHDTDKLIRQLSLVAFLMAERRPLTARDVKANVEGYSEMSDEAFARRFYSDRAELHGARRAAARRSATSSPARSSTRSAPSTTSSTGSTSTDDELAALQTRCSTCSRASSRTPSRCGSRCRTSRSAGPASTRRPPTPPSASGSRDPTTRPSSRAGSPSSRARSRSSARSSSTTGRRSATRSPSARSTRTRSASTRASGTSSATISTASAIRTFRVSRIRSDIRFATRRERDFRLPADFDVEAHRVPRRPGRSARPSARRGSPCRTTPPGGSSARSPIAGTLEDGVFETEYARPRAARRLGAAPERPRRPARAGGSCATRRRRRAAHAARAARRRTAGRRPRTARRRAPSQIAASGPPGRSRRSASACCRRCSRTCSPPAATSRDADLDADDLAHRFSIPREELQEHLSLLNLVNFGGGCYTVYAELDEDDGRARVDKELYGDVFRARAALTPLEARAIRLAIDYVGPTIAADAHKTARRACARSSRTRSGSSSSPQTPDARMPATTRRSSCARSATRSRSGGWSRSST